MNFMKSLYSLVINFKTSWDIRRLKVCMHETMILMGAMIPTTGMKISMRHGNYAEGLRFNPKLNITEFYE